MQMASQYSHFTVMLLADISLEVFVSAKATSNKLRKIMKHNQKDSYMVHFTLIQTANITCITMSIKFSSNVFWKLKCFLDLLVSDILKEIIKRQTVILTATY